MGPDKFQNITTILFDLENTLINSRAADEIACEQVFRSLLLDGVRPAVARAAVDAFLASLPAHPSPSLQWVTLQWRGALGPGAATRAPAAALLWEGARARALRPAPGIDDLLLLLRRLRFKLGLVGGPGALGQMEGAGLDEEPFDALVVGSWGGALFEEAFRKLDVAPMECALVCADPGRGAHARCGVVVCVGSTPPGGRGEPDLVVIRDLGQLPDLLPERMGFSSLYQDLRLGFFRRLREEGWASVG